ncbi:hypothetical protein [Mucilaginibacter lacusdianchii]|uniref:hypothetical protein n=1 Tax=Mucilaginibacter lacusdianchii TaxID=2684211 RepID=UPI00131AF676|nr:hypothetical protein [Mucilaginibacter sp. JXJ CY 39]
MKPTSQFNRKALIAVLTLSALSFHVHSQSQALQTNFATASKVNLTDTSYTVKSTSIIKDTVACMFNQVGSKRPMLIWRKGYIVLVNNQVTVNNQPYASKNVSSLTGLYGNEFLTASKKPLGKRNVIQVILLN